MSEVKNDKNKEVAVIDPEVAKMIELIGGQKGRTLSTEAYAKSVMLQNKAQDVKANALANRIIAEISGRQDMTTEEIKAGMIVTKTCYDKTKENLDKGFKETREAIEELGRPLAAWAWIVPILVAIFMGTIIFGVVMKMDPLMCTILGFASGLVTFIITFMINQYGGYRKGSDEYEE